MGRFPLPEPSAMRTARIARTLVAGAFVAGIAALIATQQDLPQASDLGDDDFLHAPAQSTLKPSVEPVPVDLPPAFGELVVAP